MFMEKTPERLEKFTRSGRTIAAGLYCARRILTPSAYARDARKRAACYGISVRPSRLAALGVRLAWLPASPFQALRAEGGGGPEKLHQAGEQSPAFLFRLP